MIKGIGHLAFDVTDIDVSLDFYCNKLGLKRIFHLGSDENPWLIYLKVGPQQYIELFPTGNGKQFKGQSYSHLCLEVSDIQATVEEIRSNGVEVGDITLGEDGNYQAWLSDPDGNRIELMELMPECLQLRNDK